MAGHSPWKNIQHKKALIDAKRGKLWTKLSKAITVAARLGGADTAVNVRLRTAILDARAVSMPKDNIERAIKAGTGESKGNDVEEILYEGYGPGGVAIICEIMTDNRNRTAPEIRKVFEKAGGQLGKTGCVNYLFERKGFFAIADGKTSEDKLMEVALDSGADDVKHSAGGFTVTCPPDTFLALLNALEKAGIEADVKQITRLPLTMVDVDGEMAQSVSGLLEALDDHDDVQSVVSNCNFPE